MIPQCSQIFITVLRWRQKTFQHDQQRDVFLPPAINFPQPRQYFVSLFCSHLVIPSFFASCLTRSRLRPNLGAASVAVLQEGAISASKSMFLPSVCPFFSLRGRAFLASICVLRAASSASLVAI